MAHRMHGGGGNIEPGPATLGVPVPGMTSALAIFVLIGALFVLPFKWPRMFGAVALVSLPLLLVMWALGSTSGIYAFLVLGVAFWLSGRKELWRKGQ